MAGFNYDNRRFVGTVNYDDGDLTRDTVFHYRQQDRTVWGTYEGGNIAFGTLVARLLDDGRLDMVWQYLTVSGVFESGTCKSTPEILTDGRYRLYESWKTDGPDGIEGTSVIEEIP